jgi:hypothetical protein
LIDPVPELDHGAHRQDGDEPGQDVDEYDDGGHRQKDGADEQCKFDKWMHQVVLSKQTGPDTRWHPARFVGWWLLLQFDVLQ